MPAPRSRPAGCCGSSPRWARTRWSSSSSSPAPSSPSPPGSGSATAAPTAVNRLARLHSGAVPAVALTILFDAVGKWLDPSVYDPIVGTHVPYTAWRIANFLLFTNQAWWNNMQPGTNVAYWSLGYEAPYYLVFGLAVFGPRRWAWPLAAAAFVLAGPNVAKLAPMWALGVGVDAATRRWALAPRTGLRLWLLSCAVLAAALLPIHARVFLFDPMRADGPYLRDMLHFYAVAIAFALNLLTLHAAAPLLARWIEPAARPIRWLGQRTFALYLFHQPLIQLADAVSPWPNTDASTRTIVFVGVPLSVLALAELSERRKESWRRFYAWVLAPRPAAALPPTP